MGGEGSRSGDGAGGHDDRGALARTHAVSVAPDASAAARSSGIAPAPARARHDPRDQLRRRGERLDEVLAALDARLDAAARAKGAVPDELRSHLAAMRDVHEALRGVEGRLADPGVSLLLDPEAPLVPFLVGVALFLEDTASALGRVIAEGAVRDLRGRAASGASFYFDGLVPRIRDEIEALHLVLPDAREALDELGAGLDELVFAASILHARVV